MSKISENCKNEVLAAIKKKNLKSDGVNVMARDIKPFFFSRYEISTIKKAIYQLLKDGKLSRSSNNLITVTESTAPVTPASQSNPTKEQILKAAATSPEAAKALKELFPEMFTPIKRFLNMATKDESCTTNNVGEQFQRLQDQIVSMFVANGMAPTKELVRNSIRMQLHKNQAFVVFDEKGKELFRASDSKLGACVLFAIEEKS